MFVQTVPCARYPTKGKMVLVESDINGLAKGRRLWFVHDQRTLAPLGMKARKQEQVRRSSLFDWPVYPRLNGTMLNLPRSRNRARRR
jgi:hypothetical protein